MSLMRDVIKGVRITLVLWVLVTVIYPVLMLVVGQIIFPHQANGSLIKNTQGQVIGSALIGQPFSSDRYFNSRPSTTHYSSTNPQNDPARILKTGVSGASNLAPSNQALLDRIQGKSTPESNNAIEGHIPKLQKGGVKPTADLVYTSGSSLDPHITIEGAKVQIERIAKTRGLPPNQIEILINQNIDGRFLAIFGEPGVNVLKLNLALDELSQQS